jgi:hypothetical protein
MLHTAGAERHRRGGDERREHPRKEALGVSRTEPGAGHGVHDASIMHSQAFSNYDQLAGEWALTYCPSVKPYRNIIPTLA